MSKRGVERARRWVLLTAAAGLLSASLTLPLWRMRLEAPQYRGEEALQVVVYPNALKGDLAELKTLNQYIGVHTPEALPQNRWLPVALAAGAILGLAAGGLPRQVRRLALWVAPIAVTAALAVAMAQAARQMHDLGHNRDQKTIMRGVDDFTPPLLGRAKIAQFEICSWLGLGSYLAGTAVLIQFMTALLASGHGAFVSARRPATMLPGRGSEVHA